MAMFPAQEIEKCFHNAPTPAQRVTNFLRVQPQGRVQWMGVLRTGTELNPDAQVSPIFTTPYNQLLEISIMSNPYAMIIR